MANIVITRSAIPVLHKNQGVVFETAPTPDGDDLVLTSVEAFAERTLLCTPNQAIASLASISDGAFLGQKLTLLVADAQTLRVPAALGNVDAAANLDVLKDSPLTLVWNGTAWQAS